MGKTMKKIIITALLAVTLAGQAQTKCHIEGELRDTTQGRTVIICPANVDLRVSDNYITAKADAQGRFSCDVETDKMGLYNVFLHEQWEHGSWRNENFSNPRSGLAVEAWQALHRLRCSHGGR